MINILHISDIHWGKNNLPEDEGVVMDSFVGDLKNVLSKESQEDNYCIISGDLVNRGGIQYYYNDFFDNFIKGLLKYIPLSHIIVTPGNHDIDRKWVEENFDEQKADIYNNRTESEFNDYVENTDICQFFNKFKSFQEFCITKLNIPEFDLASYYKNIDSDTSVFLLNSALCSLAGANDIVDSGHLRIDTRKLNEWISSNKGRTRILVMHHPISHFTDSIKDEIYAMCRNGLDYVIAGHEHTQNMYQVVENGAVIITTPQLYSSKNDLNGYSVIHIDEGQIIDISYREWNKRHRKFSIGLNFTGTDDGKWHNSNLKSHINSDYTQEQLQYELDEAMKSLGASPQWIERKLSTQTLNQHHDKIERDLDYIDIFNSDKSYQIVAPGQFGLTCYAKYLALKAWSMNQQYWVYIDTKGWNLSKVERLIESSHKALHIKIEDSSCVIFDNWNNNTKDIDKIFSKITRICKCKRLILLTHFNEPIVMDFDRDNNVSFSRVFLKEISRKDLRTIVGSMDHDHQIADENEVVERLNQDIIALNMHRTPLNTIQFMTAYSKDFDKRPINRTKVMDSVLRAIFDNPDSLYYSDKIDDKNCKFIMGFFCSYLAKKRVLYFTEDEFYKICTPFAEAQYNATNLRDLIQLLKTYQILEPVDCYIQFRQAYWISYFVACQMNYDASFADEMINDNHAIYDADLMDFFTGLDGRNNKAAEIACKTLLTISDKVVTSVGIDGEFNPFKDIKWRLNESRAGITQERIEQQIKDSRMPDDIKEAAADSNFDSVRPYTQQIFNFLDQYDGQHLIQILTSSSRILRNSEFISPENKELLAERIFNGWEVLMRVLFYLSPLMAKNGFGGLGGANFKLSDEFPKDYAECLKMIVINMPYNIIKWFKNDFYSDKLLPLLTRRFLCSHDNMIIRHLTALIICNARPKDLQQIIIPYISSIGKNTYYLGDLYTALRHIYSYDFMKNSELKQTEYLIKACYMKHLTGMTTPNKDAINSFEGKNGLLPSRKIDE